jgi:putative transposase
MSKHILKSHNKNLLLYHLVCPTKYRRKVFTESVEDTLKETCIGIGDRYEVHFVEIGVDDDHVHFLLQSVPILSPSRIVKIVKSITAVEIFKKHPEVKEYLWGGHFWTSGYYLNTVGASGNERVIKDYVKRQGKEYQQIYRGQLSLFEGIS